MTPTSNALSLVLDEESTNFFSCVSREEEITRSHRQKDKTKKDNDGTPTPTPTPAPRPSTASRERRHDSISASSSCPRVDALCTNEVGNKNDDEPVTVPIPESGAKPPTLSRSAPNMDDLQSILNEVAVDDVRKSRHNNGNHSYDSPGVSLEHPWNKIPEEQRKDRLSKCESVALFNENDELVLNSVQDVLEKLKISRTDAGAIKVLSIFGNTGDGKSYTLNHTFFGEENIFATSESQAAGTFGVWAAFDPFHKMLVLDTEGLLGTTANANRRTRMLLKVLALSDVVIYRTRAERLHTDMFNFLSDASEAYLKHFTKELQAACERGGLQLSIGNMGPVTIVFHETQYTAILGEEPSDAADGNLLQPSAVEMLNQRFLALDKSISAFSGLYYVGTKSPPGTRTDFKPLRKLVYSLLRNNSVRSPRSLKVILKTLHVLQEKFSGDISENTHPAFPDEYFTCSTRCLSCMVRCGNSMNHDKDGVPHHCSSSRCRYQHQYENRVFLCKRCLEAGKETTVVPKATSSKDNPWLGLAKYAWSGYVLECPSCGIIFRSRQFWYGNEEPAADASVVSTEVRHVWPGRGSNVLQGTENAARQLIDGVSYLSSAVMGITAKPTKIMMEWVNDQIAPGYWVPNAEIFACRSCTTFLTAPETKHHCRSCGGGFCDDCTKWRHPCPQRGWGDVAMRVCKPCYEAAPLALLNGSPSDVGSENDPGLTARRIEEAVQSTLGVVASAAEYPIEILKDSVRPTYWRPDGEISKCCVCAASFGPKLRIHHCRACGEGVCETCSPHRKAVPYRGWDHPVRICNTCIQLPTST